MSRGIDLENAARQAGIPVSECLDYIKNRTQALDTLNFELRKVGQEAVKNALDKLTKLAKGGVREGKEFESTDLKAAEALAKIGMEALKLSKSGVISKDPGTGQKDLFDQAPSPWALNPTE